jgi:hypothetical protein
MGKYYFRQLKSDFVFHFSPFFWENRLSRAVAAGCWMKFVSTLAVLIARTLKSWLSASFDVPP